MIRFDDVRVIWRASRGSSWGQVWRFARAIWGRRS